MSHQFTAFIWLRNFIFVFWNQQLSDMFFRWFKRAGEAFIKVPFFGAVSYLTLAVSPFCITFAVVWAVYRDVSFAWIGQDILVSISFSTVSITMFIFFHKLLIFQLSQNYWNLSSWHALFKPPPQSLFDDCNLIFVNNMQS